MVSSVAVAASRRPFRGRRGRCALVLAVLVAACGEGSPNAPPEGGPGLTVVSGSAIRDTIGALIGQPVVVKVLGENGKPAAHEPVRYVAQRVDSCPSSMWGCVTGFVSRATNPYPAQAEVVDTTDSAGRSTVFLRLGLVTGSYGLVVSVERLALVDTVAFTVLPGAPARLVFAPRDSAVDVGDSYRLRASVTDLAGNARDDAIAYESTSAVARVDASGRISGATVGKAYIRLRVNAGGRTVTDSGSVRVVPVGRVAFSGLFGPFVISDLAGGRRRVLGPDATYGVDWSPDGAQLAYAAPGGGLAVVDTLGTSTQLATPHVKYVGRPRYSADGRWIYFQGQADTITYGSMFRIHPDGSGLESIAGGRPGWSPAPGPDGNLVAYLGYDGLWLADLRAGEAHRVVESFSPQGLAWSPDGQWIAVSDGASYRVHPDGTGQTPLPGLTGYVGGWSSDGRWLLSSDDYGTARIVDATSGVAHALIYGGQYGALKH